MKKYMFSVMALLVIGGSAFGAVVQNAAFNAPEIGSIVCDGDLSDWSASTAWSDDYIIWNVVGDPMTSSTKAKFAWSDADDMLYMAVQTNEASVAQGGHAVVGYSKNPTANACLDVDGQRDMTQLCFDVAGSGVLIQNEIALYKPYVPSFPEAGIQDVEAGQITVGGVTTYELALPLWNDWVAMVNRVTLSENDVVYLYGMMENAFLGGNGTNLTYDGNPDFAGGPPIDEGTAITLVPEPTTMLLLGLGGLLLRKRR